MRISSGCGATLKAAVLRDLARRTTPVSRGAVLTAGHMVTDCAHADRGAILNAVWSVGPSRAAWATALMLGWVGGSEKVVTAARTRARLGLWLDHARLWSPMPFLCPHLVAREEMTEMVTLYRGGLAGTTEPLGGGFSWSGRVEVAAMYACIRALEHGDRPSIVRASVSREAIKLRTRTRDDECVLVEPAEGAEVHLDDQDDIKRLADAEAAERNEPTASEIINLDLRDDACWHGWPYG